MRLSSRRRLVIAGLVLAAAGITLVAVLLRRRPAPYPYPGCTPQQVEVFQLLDRFFAPDLPEHPFVEVVTSMRPGLAQRPWRRHGFLLDRREGRIRVRYLAGECVTLDEVGWYWRVEAMRADLGAHASGLAATAAPSAGERRDYAGRDIDEPIRAATRALVAARALARRGLPSQLEHAWSRLPEPLRNPEQLAAAEWFQDDLVNRVALEVGDRSQSWADLLDVHRELFERVADPSVEADVGAIAAVVADLEAGGDARTVRADLRGAFRPRRWNWDTMYLPPWDPAVPDGFDRLLARGLDAVPELIALLGDDSPTRSVGYSTRKGFGIGQAPVKELASEVLGELLAQNPRAVDVDWRSLHDHVRFVGHREYLAARMRSDSDGYRAAASYLRCCADVGGVLDAADDVDAGRRYSLLLAVLDAVTRQSDLQQRFAELMRSVVIAGDVRRTDAAWQLLRAGDEFGVQMLRRRWIEGSALDVDECGVLLASGLPAVWDELLARLADPSLRTTLMSIVATTALDNLLAHVPDADRAATEAVVRRCLLVLLADVSPAESELPKLSGQLVGRNTRAFRATHADFAAIALASWWPAEFRYDVRCTATVRRRQIDAILRANGLAVPPAEPREAGRAPDEIGPIRFGRGTDVLDAATRARLCVIERTRFDVRRVGLALAELAQSSSRRVSLDFERTGDGDGWSVVCEGHGLRGGDGVMVYESVGDTFRAGYADDGSFTASDAPAVEITFLAW